MVIIFTDTKDNKYITRFRKQEFFLYGLDTRSKIYISAGAEFMVSGPKQAPRGQLVGLPGALRQKSPEPGLFYYFSRTGHSLILQP